MKQITQLVRKQIIRMSNRFLNERDVLVRQSLFPRCDAASDRALPSGVHGHVESLPWFRHRLLASTLLVFSAMVPLRTW